MSSVIGAPIDRVDGRLKVTGAARYAAEFKAPNLAYGVLVQSTIARGRIVRLGTRRAQAAPGVLGVVSHLNAPRLVAAPSPPAGQSFIPLQDEVIHYGGQHVAVVIAETLEQAQHAATLVEIDYGAQAPAVVLADGGQPFRPRDFFGVPADRARGDAARGLAEADVRIEQTYTTPVHHHNPMEPSATVAVWDGDRLTLYESTQSISLTQFIVSTMLGLPPANVRVITPFLGGGFGCKGWVWPHTVLAAVAARHVGRPVKLVLTRAQMYTSHGHRSEAVARVGLGATRDGRLTAITHTATSHAPEFDDYPGNTGDPSLTLYACPNVSVTHRVVRVNVGNPTPTRSPASPGVDILEMALDELAYALRLDPVDLRLRNHADLNPATGRPWASKYLRECYGLAAARFGWERRNPVPRSMRAGESLVGWGMASSMHSFFGGPAAATARLFADGGVLIQSGTQDIGTGTHTVMSQVGADALGMPVERVRFELGDTNFPPAPLSAGSQTVNAVAPAVQAAAASVRRRITQLALVDARSPLYGATEVQVAAEDGRLYLRHDPARGERYEAVLARAGRDSIEGRGEWRPDPARQSERYSYGAVFAEVRVDPGLGQVRVTRLVGAYDAGRILNHKTARSQVIGGMIWGIGMALMEHTRFDRRRARVITPNLSTYLVPVHADVPEIDVLFVDQPDPASNPIGARGLGELPMTGVAAAIANAVFHATGRRVRDLPITLDKLL